MYYYFDSRLCSSLRGGGTGYLFFSISDHLTGNQLLLYIWPCTDFCLFMLFARWCMYTGTQNNSITVSGRVDVSVFVVAPEIVV